MFIELLNTFGYMNLVDREKILDDSNFTSLTIEFLLIQILNIFNKLILSNLLLVDIAIYEKLCSKPVV